MRRNLSTTPTANDTPLLAVDSLTLDAGASTTLIASLPAGKDWNRAAVRVEHGPGVAGARPLSADVVPDDVLTLVHDFLGQLAQEVDAGAVQDLITGLLGDDGTWQSQVVTDGELTAINVVPVTDARW